MKRTPLYLTAPADFLKVREIRKAAGIHTPMAIPETAIISNGCGLEFSFKMSAKMELVLSISTSVLKNRFCQARMEMSKKYGLNLICEHCFAVSTLDHYGDLRENVGKNYEILNSGIIPYDQLPEIDPIKAPICRIESFGDVASVTQAINYINICKKNPCTQFAMWTKNYGIWDRAIATEGKPDNLICIVSSLHLNKVCIAMERFPWIDKTFTVYDDETIEAMDIDINCGARACYACRKCYTKDNPIKYVSERLK